MPHLVLVFDTIVVMFGYKERRGRQWASTTPSSGGYLNYFPFVQMEEKAGTSMYPTEWWWAERQATHQSYTQICPNTLFCFEF